MTPRPGIRLLTLGPTEVRGGEGPIPLPPKLLALFAYLAVGTPRGVVRRDELLALFWPHKDAAHGRNALNQAVYQLRKRLGTELPKSRGKEELVLDGGVEADVERLEELLDADALGAALDLYRGRFLEGLYVRDAPGFERWVDGMRARIQRRLRRVALELSRKPGGVEGGPEAAVGLLRRTVEILPADEAVGRRLVQLLLRTDERTAALREYRRLSLRLRARLGVEPSDETRALIEGVEAGSESLRSLPDVVRPPSSVRRIATALTERARELVDAGRAENAAARELLKQAMRVDPTHAPAHAEFARAAGLSVQVFGGAWDELGPALDASRRAVDLVPDGWQSHFGRGYVLESAGRLAEATRSYRGAHELRPSDIETTRHLGRVLLLAGDFAGAFRWLETAFPEGVEDPGALHELGMIRHCLGYHDQGQEFYRQSLDRKPHDRWTQSSHVYWHLVTRRLDRATELARAMVDREPDGFRGIVAMGDAALFCGDVEEAIRHYERSYNLDPDNRNAGTLRSTRTALGFAHLRGGDDARGRRLLDRAERETLRALRSGASAGALCYDLASIYAARGETDRALGWLERSVEAGWLQHELLGVDPLVASLRGKERFAAARKAMERIVAEHRERLAGPGARSG